MTAAPDSATLLEALDPVRRRLRAHAGDVELVSVSGEGEVTLAFTGACVACPAQAMTFGTAVLPVLERVPGVSKVSAKGMTVSPAAMRRIRAMFGPVEP
ncbi:MAG TPA: NifU family protein [Sphingomonas sp.]|nr:NifU family protein [Sphingomonas sp.]